MKIGVWRRLLLVVGVLVVGVCAGGGLAGSALGACANEQLRAEQPYGLQLPDCRAYEKVTPAEKADNNVDNRTGSALASASGETLAYVSPGAFSGSEASVVVNKYIARRGAGGWSTQSITPRYQAFGAEQYSNIASFFSSDFSKYLVLDSTPLTSDAPAGYVNLYLANDLDGSYQALTIGPTHEEPYGWESGNHPVVAGASTDLSRVVFEADASLTPDAQPQERVQQVYEWAEGKLTLVDVPPQGAPEFTGEGRAIGAGGGPTNPIFDAWHAVSTDGSRVYFTVGNEGIQKAQGQLYLREVDEKKTIEVSKSQRSVPDPNGLLPARFWGANADGSKVFFTSCAKLTDDATASSGGPKQTCFPAENGKGTKDGLTGEEGNNDLYEYDVDSGRLTDLTVDQHDPTGAGVLGVATISEDGSYVYFVAEGALVDPAVSGQPNLYVYHDGKISFVAMLAKGFNGGGTDLSDGQVWAEDEFRAGPATHLTQVSPDGTRLAFVSEQSLTGYDNVAAEPRYCPETGRCPEVYLYNASSGGLSCVSCNPSGARPIGSATLTAENRIFGASLGIVHRSSARNFSNDASTLFFESTDAIVSRDSNGLPDAYEYRDGHVSLISTGTGNYESTFLEAGQAGNDVFIATADRLLPQDQDNSIDVYDARVDGGFSVSSSVPACDNGDACKPPVSSQPGVFGAPASATFSGVGNITSRPQALSKVKAKPKPKPKKRAKRKRARKSRNAKKGSAGRVKRS